MPARERPLRLAIENEYQLLFNLKAKSSSPLASNKREGVPICRRQQFYCHLMDMYAAYPSLTRLFANDVRDPSNVAPLTVVPNSDPWNDDPDSTDNIFLACISPFLVILFHSPHRRN